LKQADFRAFIDGHTDNVPLSADRFSSNDQLSLARATSVMNYLINRCAVPPEKLALGGYGSSHPMADNSIPAGRAMNRRVEIIFEKIN
jgi:chemotaxis protein MotB